MASIEPSTSTSTPSLVINTTTIENVLPITDINILITDNTNTTDNTNYINKHIKMFYKLMAHLLIKFKKIYTKDALDKQEDKQEDKKEDKTYDIKDFKDKFALYFQKHLYDEYGIMRRNIQNNLVILYYNKSAKGYKENNAITMICRHLILDATTMGIVSFGVPRATRLENYIKQSKINPDNADTNPDLHIFNHPEGVMFLWNPTLKTVNLVENIHTTPDTTPDTINNTEYYTRTQVSGNNSFNYDDNKQSITFLEMFNKTNINNTTRLDLIPLELTLDTTFVFNIANNAINPAHDNINTLVAIYKFKSNTQSLIEYDNIITYVLNNTEILETTLSSLYDLLYNNMITIVNVDEFINNLKIHIKDIDVKINVPVEIKSFTCYTTDADGTVLTIEIPKTKMTFTQLQSHTNYSNQLNPNGNTKGYIIYDNTGIRTKIINKDFKHKQDLRGSNSITISRDPLNSSNLFTHYWDKLMRIENGVRDFIIEYDKLPVCLLLGATLPPRYEDIFKMFAYHIVSYAANLHNTYVLAYALKRINKTDIPFSMIPLCKDLHALFYKYKTPINMDIVNKYIYTLSANKLFWRIFPSITPTPQEFIPEISQ